MQTQNYPLIFVVDDNFIYNERITSHLRSNKYQRIESFLSGEDCLKNLYKKPDIVIQEYITSEIIGNEILKESNKSNFSTEFVFLSDLDNFPKDNNYNTKLKALSGDDKFNVAPDAIKYGPHDYVVKDLDALQALIEKIGKKQHFNLQKKRTKVNFSLFLIAFASLFMSVLSLFIFLPRLFTF